MSIKCHAIAKFVASLFILSLCHLTHGQWKKAETLTGGSIVTDMITFNGDLYVAMVSAGIFKSSDEGSTWSQVSVPPQSNFLHFAISGNNLLAISYGKAFSTSDGAQWTEGAGPEAFINDVGFDGITNIFAATSNGIYHSGDGGITWARSDDTQTHTNMKSIAVQGNTVWAGADFPEAGALLTSPDGGTSWTKINRGTIAISDIVFNGNDIFLNINYDGIYKSTNNGVDWQMIRNLSNAEGKLYGEASGLYYFSRYKLYRSANAGSTWSEKDQMIPLYNSSTLYATEQHIFVGLWGGGVVRTTITGDSDWQLVNNGIAVHRINDLLVVGSNIYAGLENSFVRSSVDEGLTWDQRKDTYGLFAGSGRALLSTATEVFVGSGGGGVQRSSDNGVSWMLKNEGLISKNVLHFISAGNAIFVGTDDGVYKSVNKGDTWVKKTGDIAMLRALYTDGDNIYVGTYNGLFISDDLGETWRRISTGLPGESIGSLVHIGPVLYAATQFNGLYKTSNSGASWEKVNSEYVQVLAARNNHLLMSTVDQGLLISSDNGLTAEDIGASLPSGIVSAIEFTQENILIGKGNSGLWTRKLSQIVPPYLTIFSARHDDKFYLNSPLSIQSDQALYSSDGIALSEIGSYITVTREDGSTASYSGQIDTQKNLITLTITGAADGEAYTVTVDPLYNVSGLASLPISRTFTATDNRPPVISDVIAAGAQGETFTFDAEMFSAAFTDQDGESLVAFTVKGLPSHGILKLNDTPVAANGVIASASIGELAYIPDGDFSGTDHWYWNGSDGTDYSAADARVTMDIARITAVSAEPGSAIRLYPNPVSSKLSVEIATTEVFKIDILDITGRQVSRCLMQNSNQSPGEIDLSGLPAAVYIVTIQSSTGQRFQQKVIKQ